MKLFGLNITREKRRAQEVTARELNRLWGYGPTRSGVKVTEENALQIMAVWACVRVLSETVASLPAKVFRQQGDRRVEDRNHPVYGILHRRANSAMTSYVWRELMMVHLCTWGNHVSEIQRDGAGRIVGLWPIEPHRIQYRLDTSDPARPGLLYDVNTTKGIITLRADEVLHVRGMGTNGLVGKSPVRLAAEALGISLAAEAYGASFFKNDGRPGGTLTVPGVLSDEGFANIAKTWEEAHKGGENAWKVAILEEGTKYEPFTVPPKDAQFIETRKFQLSEIARMYRVPPHLIGDLDRATFSNIEHQGIEFLTHTIAPWLERIEQDIDLQLIGEDDLDRGYYAEHNVNGLLRGDTKARFEAYQLGRQNGWLSANDVRRLENLDPVTGGDVYLQPLNMVPAGTNVLDERAMHLAAEHRDLTPSLQALSPIVEKRASPPRLSVARSIEPVLIDAFRRIVRRETAEIRKAVAKYLAKGDKAGFRSWMETFAREHSEWMAPRLRPAFDAMADAMCNATEAEIGTAVKADDLTDFVERYVQGVASWHTGSSRGQLDALLEEEDAAAAVDQRLNEWDDRRPTKAARRERQRSSNALTKAAWAVAGLTALYWRVAGETCDLCQALDGKRTSMTVPFVGEGADVGGLVVRTSIGHPPLHDGCDCYIVPATGGRRRYTDVDLRSAFDTILKEPYHEHDHAEEDH